MMRQSTTTIPFFHLDDAHARPVIQALRSILATKTAEESFGMLIDDRMPYDLLCEYKSPTPKDIDEKGEYTGPSKDSIDLFCSLREQFDLSNVSINAALAEQYQRSAVQPSSAVFRRGLIGLVASIVHEFAINIFGDIHKSKYLTAPYLGEGLPVVPNFQHPNYVRSRDYPRGPVELVGYWMEARLFGGVVVFEHGNPPDQPGAPWIHSPRSGIARLTDEHLDAFVRLALTPDPRTSVAVVSETLPFKFCREDHGVSAFEAYEYGLFRNRYEYREPPPFEESCTQFGLRHNDIRQLAVQMQSSDRTGGRAGFTPETRALFARHGIAMPPYPPYPS